MSTLQRNALKARAFATLARVSARLALLPNRLVPPPFRLLQIGSAFWHSSALHAAARLDLATLLGDVELSVAELSARSGAAPDALARLLRLLAAMEVFEEAAPGVWRNNRLSQALRSDRGESVRAMILMHGSPEMSRPWYEQLEAGIRRGEPPFRLAHGQDLYEWMDAHPRFDALFAQAMEQVEALAGDSFATEFDWRAFERVIDVGGSRGAKALAILKRHTHLQAVVVDRPQVIEDATRHWTARGESACLTRMRFETGNVFDALPPPRGPKDVYLLSAVLHGFDDEACVRALENVARVARGGGSPMVLLEMVMPERRADAASASFDMQMFMATTGRERTHREWQQLFRRAGVRLEEVIQLASMGQMLVLRASPSP